MSSDARDNYIRRLSSSSGSSGSSSSSSSNSSSSSSSSSNNSSQNNNQTGQNNNNQGGQHKFLTRLEQLQAQGQGNTAQAQVYKNYLAGVVSPQDQSSSNTPFYERQTLLDDYYAGIQPTYNQHGLPSAALDKIKGHSLYKAGMSMTPTSNMLFGYGSPFGASTGTTASSPVVQDALLNMMGQYYNKYDYNQGYYNEEGQFVPQDAIDAALSNFYPTVMMQDGPPGSEPYAAFGGANYMGDQAVAELMASGHKLVEDQFIKNPTAGYGGGGGGYGGGGGFNYGYGSGGGGGGGGGGYYYDVGMQGQPKQRGQVGPGALQEQVNQAFLSGGKPFAKGGLVSLVED